MFLALNLPTVAQDVKALEDVGLSTLIRCKGAYPDKEGNLVQENSYAVSIDDFRAAGEPLLDLLAVSGQDAVLHRDGEFQCWLCKREDNYERVYSPEGVKAQWIGHWREVPETQVNGRPHTFVHNRYFVAVK